MNYSEVEAKVREATNDDAWGPHGALMQEVAQYTFTYEHFPEVMGMLWKRMLHDNKKNWRRVYKVNLISISEIEFTKFKTDSLLTDLVQKLARDHSYTKHYNADHM